MHSQGRESFLPPFFYLLLMTSAADHPAGSREAR